MVVQLEKCCCCVNLRLGIIIFASLAIALSVFQIGAEVVDIADEDDDDHVHPAGNSTTPSGDEDDDADEAYGYKATAITSEVFTIIAALLLLIGVLKSRPVLLMIWIVGQVIVSIILIILIIGTYFGISDEDDSAVFPLLMIVEVVVTIYFILVVYSHYRNLKNGQQ